MKIQNIGFIGVRGHYERILRCLSDYPHLRVSGVCQAGEESVHPILHWCEQHRQLPRIFDDHRLMIDSVLPDVVVICGPLESHADMAIDCIHRGIHVLIEKPVALHFKDIERLRKALADYPRVHFAALQISRYEPGFFTAWHLVREGAIGDVRLINAQKSYRLGKRGPFFEKRETYGGTIPWVGSHGIDWILWIGGHRIKSVTALHTDQGAPRSVGTMEMTALCQFVLCGNRFASMTIDMLRPTNAPSHGDDRLRIVGTKGVMEVTPKSVRLINDQHDGSTPYPLREPPTVLQDFIDHVEGRVPALIGAHDSLAITAACLLARESADSRQTLSAEDLTSLVLKSIPVTPFSRNEHPLPERVQLEV